MKHWLEIEDDLVEFGIKNKVTSLKDLVAKYHSAKEDKYIIYDYDYLFNKLENAIMGHCWTKAKKIIDVLDFAESNIDVKFEDMYFVYTDDEYQYISPALEETLINRITRG